MKILRAFQIASMNCLKKAAFHNVINRLMKPSSVELACKALNALLLWWQVGFIYCLQQNASGLSASPCFEHHKSGFALAVIAGLILSKPTLTGMSAVEAVRGT